MQIPEFAFSGVTFARQSGAKKFCLGYAGAYRVAWRSVGELPHGVHV